MRYKENPITNFFNKILKTDSCWEWTAAKCPKGYGKFWNGCKIISAHRYSFELHFHDIPPNMHVLHACDNPSCVNPDHLWLGTNEENHKDKLRKGRQSKGTKHWNYQSGIFTVKKE